MTAGRIGADRANRLHRTLVYGIVTVFLAIAFALLSAGSQRLAAIASFPSELATMTGADLVFRPLGAVDLRGVPRQWGVVPGITALAARTPPFTRMTAIGTRLTTI